MNILIPDSWLREYLTTNASPNDIQRCLSLCGPSVERIEKLKGETIYNIEITTNRVDCMSVIGIAREASAILPQFGFSAKLTIPRLSDFKTGNIPGLTIKNDSRLCHRILALQIRNVKVFPSPEWLVKRLQAVGQRPLNNLVDITNYVTWETGHPTHVFDFNRLTSGKMVIRKAQKGERLTTFDEKSYTLSGGEVVIEDGNNSIIDLPSIMGTANSVIVPSTTTALFFIDDVDSQMVRFASMTHAIRTQAAILMEKNVDPRLAPLAMSRIVTLIKQIMPQAQVGELTDIYPAPAKPTSISLSMSQISGLLGVTIAPDKITDILKRLGFGITRQKSRFTVIPPSWRYLDVTIPEDIIEEIARIYGYFNIPSQLMKGGLPLNYSDLQFRLESRIKTALKYLGFTEIYTYSLVDTDNGLKLKNPLSSEWRYLRTSLTPSHLKVINLNQGRAEVLNFYEIANVYLPRQKDLPVEEPRLIISTTDTAYYRLKGIIDALLADVGLPKIVPDIKTYPEALVWEIPLQPLFSKASPVKTYTPISKYSPIIEDVNIHLTVTYAELEKEITSISNLIKQIDVVDVYGDKLTLRITYHSDTRQLSDEDVAPLRDKINRLNLQTGIS